MRPKQIEKIVIPQVSASTKNAIKRKTAFNLPDRPSDMGMKPAEIKESFWSPVIGETYSAIAELDRVIRDINEAFDEIVYPPFVDGEGAYSVIQEDADNSNNAYADNSLSLGRRTTAGSKAFRLIGYNAGDKTYTLDSTEGIEVGDYYSIYWRRRRNKFGKVTGVNGNVITVDNLFVTDGTDAEKTEYLASANIRIVGKPHIGTITVGDTAVASGEGTIAAEDYSDVGGLDNISDGRYAFTRGWRNITGYLGATFGQDNENLGLKGFIGGQENYVGPTVERAAVFNYLNKILANDGTAIGSNNIIDAGGVRGFVGGEGNVVNRPNQTKLGRYTTRTTSALFAIGNGTASNPANAFSVFEGGHAEVQRVAEESGLSVVNIDFLNRYSSNLYESAEEFFKDYLNTTGGRGFGFVPRIESRRGEIPHVNNLVYVEMSNGRGVNGYPLTVYAQANSVVERDENGQICVKLQPTANEHAASKAFVEQTVNKGINAFATEVTDNGTYEKFAELVSYVAKHGGEAAEMGAAITELEKRYAGIEQKHAADVLALTASLDKKAAEGHAHAGVYSPVGHNHDERYAGKNDVSSLVIESLENSENVNVAIERAVDAQIGNFIKREDLPNEISLYFGTGTLGLAYTFYDAGTDFADYYICTGIGSAKYEDITIASTYNQHPVSHIAENAFKGCSGIISVTIPGSITHIGESAFEACTNLVSVAMPDSVSSIGAAAFYNCKNLKNVVLSETLEVIPDYAFEFCEALKDVTIPDSVTTIEAEAFSDSGLSSITFGSSITSIGDGAFARCDLSEIIIPDSVTDIWENAFADCRWLHTVTLGAGITKIAQRAFANCALEMIKIPVTVTSIELSAFEKCNRLTHVYYGGTEEQWKSIAVDDGNEQLISATIHYGGYSENLEFKLNADEQSWSVIGIGGCTDIDIFIPPQHKDMPVTAIGGKAFGGSSEIRSVTIPTGVVSIGDNAFEVCGRLTSAVIPASVTSIGENAFIGCENLTSIYYSGTESQWRDLTSGKNLGIGDKVTIHYNS